MATRRGTGGIDRNVRLETAQCRCLRDVDVADGALGRWDGMALFFAAAVVPKLHRFSFRRRPGNIRRAGQFVAAVALLSGWFLTTPMAVETRGVIVRRRLERIDCRSVAVNPTSRRRNRRFRIWDMTDLAVVEFLRLVIERVRGLHQGSATELPKPWSQRQRCDHVLVFVMWKLDHELLRPARIAKAQARIITRGSVCVADRANHGLSAFEELRSMAADAGVVVGKVGNVRKIPHLLPVRSRYFVASTAAFLVLFGCV